MRKERILLLSAPRSGSTYVCSMFNAYMNNTLPDYVLLPQEMLNYENWRKTKEKQILNTGFFDFLGKDYDAISKNRNTMRDAFIKCLDRDQYIFKYFPYVMENLFKFEEMIEICKHWDIKIVGLYRRNLIDSIISILISNATGVWNLSIDDDGQQDTSKIDINQDHVDYMVKTYKRQLHFFKQLKDQNLLYNILEYEKLAFNITDLDKLLHSRDHNIIMPAKTKKLTTSQEKQKIFQNNEEVQKIIISSLEKFNMNMEIEFK